MTNLTLIPEECQTRIRKLLSKDTAFESGCFITKEWQLLKFENLSSNPACHIQASRGAMETMTDLLLEDNLFGWAHSHPKWPAIPSLTDITFHQYPVYMVIYSLCDDDMRIYSPQEIDCIENERQTFEYLIKDE